jgi:alpha-tubulin suppressor-like RCC1 family protein
MRHLRILMSAIVIASLACGGGGDGGSTGPAATVDHVVMSATTATIQVGQTVSLTAQGVDASGAPVAAGTTWSSASNAIATVNATGTVTGVAPGTVDIIATIKGKTGHTAVTVTTQASGAYTDVTVGRELWTTCASATNARTLCWGQNASGAVGDGTTADKSSPTPVSGSVSFAQVVAGTARSCGRTTGGDVYCWGNLHFGTGTTDPALSPRLVSSGLALVDISNGETDMCGRNASGVAYCWGTNTNGASGDGTNAVHQTPVAVSGGLAFAQIVAGRDFSCGRTAAGVAYCWGANNLGQVGDGTNTNRLVPTRVSGSLTFTTLSAGMEAACGVVSDGSVYCWGANLIGGANNLSPARVNSAQSFAQVSVGVFHACALTAAGAAWCWGENDHGELGINSIGGSKSTATAVSGGLAFAKISAGHWYTCGVTTTGALYCWGGNIFGNLGLGDTGAVLVPTLVK